MVLANPKNRSLACIHTQHHAAAEHGLPSNFATKRRTQACAQANIEGSVCARVFISTRTHKPMQELNDYVRRQMHTHTRSCTL